MKKILVANGPNLNLLGTRAPDVYGSTTLAELEEKCSQWAETHGLETAFFQSNHEGALLDRLHLRDFDGVILNAGALTHTSYALRDAIEAIQRPVVEVHISNIMEREEWRRISLISEVCLHSIYGRGIDGYRWALLHLLHSHQSPPRVIRYGESTDQFGHLRLPPGQGPHPTVVLVHGGFWRHQWTFDTFEAAAVDLVDRGVATFNLEYRRMGTGGGAVETTTDVVSACRAISQHPGVDPDRMAIIGHSAGGQLAVFAAAALPEMFRVAIPIGGVLDLALAMRQGTGEGAVEEFLGEQSLSRFSPIELLPIETPVVIAHGTGDESVPFEQAERFVEAAGRSARPLWFEGAGHVEVLDPSHSMWKRVATELITTLSP